VSINKRLHVSDMFRDTKEGTKRSGKVHGIDKYIRNNIGDCGIYTYIKCDEVVIPSPSRRHPHRLPTIELGA
jgi:hypothetical protein